MFGSISVVGDEKGVFVVEHFAMILGIAAGDEVVVGLQVAMLDHTTLCFYLKNV